MSYYIGIDPGLAGAAVVLDESGKIVASYPFKRDVTGLDIRKLRDFLTPYTENATVVIEQVHALFGSSASSTFTFGYVCGQIEAVVSCLECRYILVQPKVWQKEAFTGISEIRKPNTITSAGKEIRGKVDAKKMALQAVGRLFPGVKLTPTEKSIKPHDGLVDALLIAEFCRRKYK